MVPTSEVVSTRVHLRASAADKPQRQGASVNTKLLVGASLVL